MILVPWAHMWTYRCPFCGTIATEYHPDTYKPRKGWGRCHGAGCGRSWRMDAEAASAPAQQRYKEGSS